MRITFLLLALTLFLAAPAVRAQNSDLAFLVGLASPVSGADSNGTASASLGFSFAFEYAVQLKEKTAGQLFLELPLLFDVNSEDVSTASSASNINRTVIFFTPGIRWKFTPAARVSFYLSGGGGIAGVARSANVSTQNTASSAVSGGVTGALGVAGGVDFRLTRLVSLRAEGRDAVSLGTILGSHNHGFFMFGVAFHF